MTLARAISPDGYVVIDMRTRLETLDTHDMGAADAFAACSYVRAMLLWSAIPFAATVWS